MKVGRAILGYAGAVIVVGALLAPCVFQLLQPHLPDVPFHRIFNRTLLGVALLGLWPLFRRLQIRSWAEIGFARRSDWWQQALLGGGLGLLTFGIGGALLIGLGVRALAFAPVPWLGLLLTGIVVGVFEETFFRGAIFSTLRRGWPVWLALLVTSAIYSALHFLKPKGGTEFAINWLTGFEYLAFVIQNSAQRPGTAIGFVTLLLAGGVLTIALVRTGSLYLSIGLHAGWVIALKLFAGQTDPVGGRQWWGGSSLVDNMLVWPVLLVLGIVIWRWPQRS
ncbi:MAG: CPBP family intramembrane glutamic endopeptidase [Verrucomicrobiota bacterium]